MKYNKLVRDKIPKIIERNGAKAITRKLTDEEYKEYLEKKLDEEVAEFHESKTVEELADILEVLYALCHTLGCNERTLHSKCADKFYERGGFRKKILLIETIEGTENE